MFQKVTKTFSIITPIYNSAHLMGKYFESLESQKYKDFEVILIDDCSTDNSYEVLLEHQVNSSLNMIIERLPQNSGPGIARNRGIELAKGEWITFVDNDDWVSEELLTCVKEVIENNRVNCVVYDYYTTNGTHDSISSSVYYGSNGLIPISDAIISVRNHTFGKFYRLDCINKGKIRFPNLRTAEDMAFVPQALVACSSIYYLARQLYYYYQRIDSISNNSKFGVSNTISAYEIINQKLGCKYSIEIREKSVIDKLYCGTKTLCNEGYSNEDICIYIMEYEKYNPNWWKSPIVKSVGKAKFIFLFFIKYRMIFVLRVLSSFHRFLIKKGL